LAKSKIYNFSLRQATLLSIGLDPVSPEYYEHMLYKQTEYK